MTGIDIIEKIFVPLIAAFLGAFGAFMYQRRMEFRREKRAIIQTLMAYRHVAAYEPEWTKALNMVDIVFIKDRKVRDLVHKYFAYTKPPMFNTGQHIDVIFELLYEMGQSVGYKGLRYIDIRDFYDPKALNIYYPNRNDSIPPEGDAPVPMPQS